MTEHFLSEVLRPDVSTLDASRMTAGAPGLPTAFRWRDQTLRVTGVLRTWRETGPCHHGSGEVYVRKHWFEVMTDDGQKLKIYFERQARSGRSRDRWWLFTLQDGNPPGAQAPDRPSPHRRPATHPSHSTPKGARP